VRALREQASAALFNVATRGDASRSVPEKNREKLTQLGELLLVGLVGNDGLLGSLGLLNSLLNGDEPAIALSGSLRLESVLAAVELEVESDGAILDELGGIGLTMLAHYP
jgi:hypothetical protein